MTADRDGTFIRINGVSKRFGRVVAVDQADLVVARGEFFSLLGPSGCGKTTLLRMIGGFEFPDEGRIVLDGADVTDDPPNLRPTNMVFQSYAIFPHLNVRDNIAYGLRNDRLSAPERDRRVDEALALVKLTGYGARRSQELSGGQRQRVALARALVKRPKVLLLDEPLGALDKRLREDMQVELRQLQKSLGTTFVFVTHDQEEALSMSDRVAVMSGGRIVQVGTPADLYERPVCREVADFIGTMNFFTGRVRSAANGTVMVETDALKTVTIRHTGGFAANAPVLVAIRPESFSLSAAPPAGVSVRGTIMGASYLGDRRQFQIALDGSVDVIVAQNASSAAARFHVDDTVHVAWSEDRIILLPPE